MDGLNASFAGGMGSRMFNNYINKNYNPESYSATVDNMLGSFLAGVSEGVNGITDRENLYEGFIGMSAPLTSGIVSPQVLSTPHDTWNAVIKGVDAQGNRLNIGEKMSQIINNPLLNTYAELKEKDRRVTTAVDAINKVVENHKGDLETASRLLYSLHDDGSPLYKMPASEDPEVPTLLDSKDAKLYKAFTIMQVLNTLQGIEGGSKA